MSTPTILHIINHTHWDREWFLTAEYTSRWIPRLVERIEQLAAENASFHYFLDGQTLVIEDLFAVAPAHKDRARALIGRGQLQIGPYYCQPDWRLSSGELLIRNLQLGQQDMRRHGAPVQSAGWLVDTFGHISQAPQIHRLFAIESVFVWRGVPRLEPYFIWQGPDGSALFTVNLFGGYRNLYGVTHAPQVALQRLHAEVDKLQPFYPTPDLPLFDGYDLEDNPEDPVRFYTAQLGDELQQRMPDLVLSETTPSGFARAIASKSLSLPTLHGELNSGKYGATFPGTLSARTYLKVMARDCERLLFSRVEPLAALAHLCGRSYDEARYDGWARRLLQNAVHDCICGVSIDLVHEKMEDSYRRAFDEMAGDLQASLDAVMPAFQSGDYAVSTSPFVSESWHVVGDALLQARTGGVGVSPIVARHALEDVSHPVPSFHWRNDHYAAHVQSADGAVHLDAPGLGALGAFVVFRERGDTYSSEAAEQLGQLQPVSPLTIVQQSEKHAVLHFRAAWHGMDAQVSCDVRLWFDPTPLIRWQIDLDSAGSDLRVEMVFETGPLDGVYAGMPFDLVRRPFADSDLLPRELPASLSGVLLGQRELNAVRDFPMHDFVAAARQDGDSLAVFTHGIRSYRADAGGRLSLPLRRAVQWLTAPDLQDRVGDAGPFFYVPGARCERTVRHHVALAVGAIAPDAMAVQRLNESFQNPPLIVRVQGPGPWRRWRFLQEELPLSSLHVRQGALLARFYNPLSRPHRLGRSYRRADVWGREDDPVAVAAPHQILTILPPTAEPPPASQERTAVSLLTPPLWRVGPERARPDPGVLQELESRVHSLGQQVAAVRAEQEAAGGAQRLRLQHRAFILEREQLEYELSLALNRRRLQQGDTLTPDFLYTPDPEIAAIGEALNRLRIKRRIFDYVVQSL